MFTSLEDFPFDRVVGSEYERPAFGDVYEGTITDYDHEPGESAVFYDGPYDVFTIDLSVHNVLGFTWRYVGANVVITVPRIGEFRILGAKPPA